MTRRVQLTLFVQGPAAEAIEQARITLDPVQFGWIPAHATLCREDEVEGLQSAALRERLAGWEAGPLAIGFGAPEPFGTHGILLPRLHGDDVRCRYPASARGRSPSRSPAPYGS